MQTIIIKKINDECEIIEVYENINEKYAEFINSSDPQKYIYDELLCKYFYAEEMTDKIKIRNQLINLFMPVFTNLAKKYAGNGYSIEDLTHNQIIEFADMLDKYVCNDYKQNFLTYIKCTLERYLNQFFKKKEFDCKANDYYFLPSSEEDQTTKQMILNNFLSDDLKKVLSTLTPREKEVLENLFFKELSLEEQSNKMNISKVRVEQIEAKALRKLRHPSRSKRIKHYLD